MKKLVQSALLLLAVNVTFAQNYLISTGNTFQIVDTSDANSQPSSIATGFNLMDEFELTYVPSKKLYYGITFNPNSQSVNLFQYSTCSGATTIAPITLNGNPIKRSEAIAHDPITNKTVISFGDNILPQNSFMLGYIDIETAKIIAYDTMTTANSTTQPDIDGLEFVNGELWSIDAGNARPSSIYLVDSISNTLSLIATTKTPNLNDLSYDGGEFLFGFSSTTNELVKIDTASLQTTVIGTTSEVFYASAFGPIQNRLEGGDLYTLSNNNVIAINTTDSSYTELAELPIGGYSGLAYHPSNNALYFVSNETLPLTLKSIDSCLSLSEIGEISFVSGSNQTAPFRIAEGLSFNTYDENLYITIGDSKSNLYQSQHLGTIDVQTAEVTYISSISRTLDNEGDDIEFGDSILYTLDGTGSTKTILYETELETGLSKSIGSTNYLGVNSIAYQKSQNVLFGLISSSRSIASVNTGNGSLNGFMLSLPSKYTGVIELTTSSPGYYIPKITSLNNTLQSNNLNLFPNPATGFVNSKIDLQSANIEIMDASGVKRSDFTISGNQISTSNFEQGTYFIRINNGESVITEKIIILK